MGKRALRNHFTLRRGLGYGLIALILAIAAFGGAFGVGGSSPNQLAAHAQEDDADATSITKQLGEGQVAITIPVKSTQLPYGLQTGDYVDFLVSFLFIDVDPEFQSPLPNGVSLITRLETGVLNFDEVRTGRTEASPLSPEGVLLSPSEPQMPRQVTQATVQSIEVIHIENLPEPTSPGHSANITLAVSQQNALTIFWVLEEELSFLLVSHGDNQVANSNPVSLDYMIRNYNAVPPNALEFQLIQPEE